MSENRLLSVVVPVLRDGPDAAADLAAAHARHREALATLDRPLEFVYVLDGELPEARATLLKLRAEGQDLEILAHAHAFGEAACLASGFRHTKGALVVTLPARPSVDAAGVERLLTAAANHDVVVGARRFEGSSPKPRKLERAASKLFGRDYTDLRSDVRVVRRSVADELVLYGNRQAFLPLVAEAAGFTAAEVELPVAQPPARAGAPKPANLLDLLSSWFLLRFMRRPFRFFGGFGLTVLGLGLAFTAWLVFARLFLGVPLLDRPALVLSSLMVVLGIQVLATGLIGEIVTFAYTKEQRDYRVERVIE